MPLRLTRSRPRLLGAAFLLLLPVLAVALAGFDEPLLSRFVPGGFVLLLLLVLAALRSALVTRAGERDRLRADAARSGMHDPVTGLLKRHSFAKAARHMLEETQAAGHSRADGAFALHVVQIDRFQPFIEIFGTDAGNRLLKQIADVLVAPEGNHPLVGRIAPDQFAVLETVARSVKAPDLPGPPDDSAVTLLPSRLRSTFADMIVPGLPPLPVTANVGTTVTTRDDIQRGMTYDVLLTQAELALSAALAAGGGDRCFTTAMREARERRLMIEHRLALALSEGSFTLAFQPICSGRTREIVGFETLLRLKDAAGRPIPPSEFIPIAEACGMMGRIGDWVLNAACALGAGLPENLFVAVNLSAQQFLPDSRTGATLSQRVAGAAAANGFDPHRLELEITETLLIENSELINRELMRFCEMGITLAMDDFGTGYSSLGYLWKLPFSKVKIDRSFVEGLAAGKTNARIIVEAIVALCHRLEMVVCVEGVETEAQALLFEALNCAQLQGYHLGRPESYEATQLLLSADASARSNRLFRGAGRGK